MRSHAPSCRLLLQEANLKVSITVPASLQNDPAALAAFTDDFKASLAAYFGIPVSQVVINQVGAVAYWVKPGISEVASLCIIQIPRCCSSVRYRRYVVNLGFASS
jgi:hypothetical protein